MDCISWIVFKDFDQKYFQLHRRKTLNASCEKIVQFEGWHIQMKMRNFSITRIFYSLGESSSLLWTFICNTIISYAGIVLFSKTIFFLLKKNPDVFYHLRLTRLAHSLCSCSFPPDLRMVIQICHLNHSLILYGVVRILLECLGPFNCFMFWSLHSALDPQPFS